MIDAPDSRWLDFIKMIFGFLLLTMLCCLAMVIALGKVEQATSHGLQEILGGLLVLSGSYAHWAFGSSTKEEAK